MALQVWLPLTKDLRNQGLSNVTVTNSGATFNSAGKLGGCYIFDGADDAINIGNLSALVETNFSFACWFYHSDTWSTKSYETILGGPSGFELEAKNSSTNSPVIKAYSWGGGSFTYELNKWNHLVMTRTSSETKFYLNGELKLTGTVGSIPSGDYFVGAWKTSTSQNYKGSICDVRIYDHCLSPMEVKQLSQGLVLHYPLNRMGFGQENLFKNSSLTDLTSSNLSTKIYYQGSYIPEITQDGLKFTWTGSSAREIDLWLDKTLKADTYYTLSFIYRNNMAIGSSFYLRKDGSLVGYWSQPTIPYSEDWSIYRCTFKIVNYQSNDATTGTLLTLFYSGYTANKWIELKQNSIKLEEGSIPTPWSPAPSDDLATQMGLNSNIEYDTSGYCNNGTRTGTFDWTSDTPKYQVSTSLSNNASKLHISGLSTSGFGNSYSIAWWGKTNSFNGLMQWGFSDGIRLNGIFNGNLWNTGDSVNNPLYIPGTTTQVTIPTTNVWHHFVMTGDGTTCKVYKDGELWGQAKTYKAISGTSIYFNGWDSGTSYSNNNGYSMSDFRIYATALSASDVKSLYQNCATIDPDGTIHGQIRS